MATTDEATAQLAARQNGGTDVQKRQPDKPAFVQLLEQHTDAIAGALPQAGVTPQQLIRVAVTCVRDNPTLGRCSPHSIAGALMQAAHVGLLPGGTLGHAHLVPYWNRDVKGFEAQFQIGWQGLLQLARRSGEVEEVWADVIRQHDKWEIRRGLDRDLIHEPAYGTDRGEVIFAYAVAKYSSGARDWVVLDREDLDKRKQMSQTGRQNKGPWADHFEAMCRKSAIKALAPFMPLSLDDQRAFAADGGVVRWDPTRADDLEPVDPDRGDIEATVVDPPAVDAGAPEPDPEPEPDGPTNYRKLKKAQLVLRCNERGLDTEGTVDELVARLEADDADDQDSADAESAPDDEGLGADADTGEDGGADEAPTNTEPDEEPPLGADPEVGPEPSSPGPDEEPAAEDDADRKVLRARAYAKARENGVTSRDLTAFLQAVYSIDTLDDLDAANLELLIAKLDEDGGADDVTETAARWLEGDSDG